MNGSIGRLVIAVAVLVAGWWVYGWLFSDSRRIERELEEIRELLSKSGHEAELAAVARAGDVTGRFADPFEVRARDYGGSMTDRRSVAGTIHRYRSSADRIAVIFSDHDLTVDGSRATMEFVAEFQTTLLDGLSGSERYRFRIDWREQDGDWRIALVDLLEVVEGPRGGWPF